MVESNARNGENTHKVICHNCFKVDSLPRKIDQLPLCLEKSRSSVTTSFANVVSKDGAKVTFPRKRHKNNDVRKEELKMSKKTKNVCWES